MGLLKTGIKAAIAVKTADVIHERVLARQQQHAAVQGHPAPTAEVAQAAPAAAMAPGQPAPAAAIAAAQPAPAPPVAPAPAPVTAPMGDKLDQLRQLGELKATGVLTDAEFESQKASILSYS